MAARHRRKDAAQASAAAPGCEPAPCGCATAAGSRSWSTTSSLVSTSRSASITCWRTVSATQRSRSCACHAWPSTSTTTARTSIPGTSRTVRATAAGRATPLVSTSSRSGRGRRSVIRRKAPNRSPPTAQQMQPPARLMTSPSTPPSASTIRSASMETSPKSLTSTARRNPLASRSQRLSRVVLPAPSQPPSTTVGNGARRWVS